MTTTISDYTNGLPCDLHEIAYCAICREQAGLRRTSKAGNGLVAFDNDCTNASFVEITGASYEEAVEIFRAAGQVAGKGSSEEVIRAAFESAGYEFRLSGLDLVGAVSASAGTGRAFVVIGQKGRKRHAWTIVDGAMYRSFRPPFRYNIYEVVA